MTLFHIYFWISLVLLGWALARLLSDINRLLAAGKRVQWAPETLLLMAVVTLAIAMVGLDQWVLRTVETTDRLQSLLQVAKLFALHFAAAFVLPSNRWAADPIVTRDYYNSSRRLMFTPLVAALAFFSAYRLLAHERTLTWVDWAGALFLPVLFLVLIFARRTWLTILLLVAGLLALGFQIVTEILSLLPAPTA